MELGVCAACVKGDGLEAQMEALSGIGFDFIEPAWKEEADLAKLGEAFGKELRALGERTGCPVYSAILGSFPDLGLRIKDAEGAAKELDILTRACETLAAAGGEVLLLPNYCDANDPGYDDLYTGFLRESADAASKLNVKLGIEHIPASKYRNTSVQVCELVELVDRPNVGVYYDITNGLYAGEDTLTNAKRVAPRTVQYHVKGSRKGGKSLEQMPLKEMKDIFAAAGYSGRVALEDGPREEGETNEALAGMLKTLRATGY